MITKQELCKKIEEIHPEMGICGRDFDVEFNEKAKAWAVDFHQGKQHLRTYVELDEADSCLEKDRCLPLALQIAQLKSNFEKKAHDSVPKKDNQQLQ